MSSQDVQARFHEEWLGLAQPYEGMVFSVPVLAGAQIMPEIGAELSARFKQTLVAPKGDEVPGHIGDLQGFFEDFLGYQTPGMMVARAALPADLRFYAQEGRQEIRPSFVVARGPFDVAATAAMDDLFAGFGSESAAAEVTQPNASASDSSPYVALVWDLRDDAGQAGLGLSLDKPEELTGTWRYPPTAKFERLLRHTGVPVGLLCNGYDLRLIYAPAGESTSHLTFRTADMQQPSGRPVLAAFELLLNAKRTYTAAEVFTFPGLLRESRRRQADVTKDLAEQVFAAVELLLEGFEQAAARDSAEGRINWLREALEADDDHLYQGVLSVVLRLVFLLYAEDQGLLPTSNITYARHLSVQGLYDDLVDDSGMHPESMHHRFGAYGRLLALFRGMFLGVAHGELQLPPRRGKLFDPSSYPFLEGGLPGSTAAIVLPDARAAVQPPSVDDGVVHAVLHRLIVFEGQRLSYRAVDVEQLGAIYESLMGYHVLRVETEAVRFGSHRVWVETGMLRKQKPAERSKSLKEICGLSAAQIAKVEAALQGHASEAALAEALNELSPGKKHEKATRHHAPAGKLVLQPGDERRRSGSHYTPRSLTERIVRRTLEPLLACLGAEPSEPQLLSLKICDPAMGSGAFLVEVTRQLADQLVATWTREGKLAALTEEFDDAHLHARRLVVQRCVYGVDKNAAAVELAKLSLWLITLSGELPFTFVDHALRHGDSLVGLNIEQITSFHWKPDKQVPLFKQVLEESLNEALEHRGELLDLAKNEDARSQEQKRRLLDHADHATERVRLVADLCVGAFFAAPTDKARETECKRRMMLVEQWLAGDESAEPELRGMAVEIRAQHAPFHWWLEFPEVFYQARPDPLCGGAVNGAAFMDGFVGNPPFAGKNNIADSSGPVYLDWLKVVHTGAHGNADLSSHFFRRAATLLGEHGSFGLIATNTIAQGDTRATGIKALIADQWTLYDATNSMPWPGAAAVTVSVVHGSRGLPSSDLRRALDGQVVDSINSRLRPKPERQDAGPLKANDDCSYQGSIVLGMGFTLAPEERDALVSANPSNAQRIFPYLGGQEVNTSPTQDFDRYVISFGEMSLEQAEAWPDLIAIVREKVKPERDQNNRDVRKRYWWRFAETTPALYAALAPLKRCLVTLFTSKHLTISFVDTSCILANTLYVFPLDSHTAFAVLQSRIHEPWARLLSSSMKTDLRYAASDCFDTFPFPLPSPRTVLPAVEAVGEALYEARARFMLETDQGLTKTYNALKDPSSTDERVLTLRRLHEAMDRAVLDAYGWSDLPVPPFCPLSTADKAHLAAFEDEVIDRLYLLNAERAREEKRLALGTKPKGKTGKGKAKKKNNEDPQPMLRALGDADDNDSQS